MITIKNKLALAKMKRAGQALAEIFEEIQPLLRPGLSTLEIDGDIAKRLAQKGLTSRTKGYMGYKHVSCISVNDEVVHGVPSKDTLLVSGDVVKIDICASWKGYCGDMARTFFIVQSTPESKKLAEVAQSALDKGIEMARVGNRLTDISAAIQVEVERHGFGVVRDFAGHGIGKQLHEDPEILNYGKPGKGPVLRAGMTFAIEPMITQGAYDVYITEDGWTVKTKDKSLAAHVEDTIAITDQGPRILTRLQKEGGK
ncbi:MAG: methionyl aminopeptidase [Alteromonas naphthalenivorans]|jgi:methionyl aminopeptidase